MYLKPLLTFLCIFSVLASLYSQPVELSLGNGFKAFYSPPAGWTKGTGYDGQYCFNKSGNTVPIC